MDDPLTGLCRWVPGQRVNYLRRKYDILAISDNGLYLGRVVGGQSFLKHYVSGVDLTHVMTVK